MKKYRNVIITVLVFVVIIVGVFYLSKLGEEKYFKEVSYNTYETLLEKSVLLYVSSKEKEEDLTFVKDYAREKGLELKYIYTEDLTDKQKEELLGEEEQALIYGKKGKSNTYTEELDTLGITNFLTEQKVLPRTYIEITAQEYQKLVQSDNFVVVIGATGCGHCDRYKPVLQKVINEKDVDIYYIDVSTLDELGYIILVENSEYLMSGDWGTPTTLLFQKGKEVAYLGGYAEKEELIKFLKDNKVIE